MKIVTKEYKLYELDELKPAAKEEAILAWAKFEADYMTEDSAFWHCAEEMDKMSTPWFLTEKILEDHREDIIEHIKSNNFLFFVNGDPIPIELYSV